MLSRAPRSARCSNQSHDQVRRVKYWQDNGAGEGGVFGAGSCNLLSAGFDADGCSNVRAASESLLDGRRQKCQTGGGWRWQL